MTYRPHTAFATTSPRGLRRESVPMRLYQLAKRDAAWDPRRLDLAADARDWERLTASERDLLLRLTSLFQAAEEGMTMDIAPLLYFMASERRIEDQIFLATLVADEAKHTEFFRRVLDEVCGAPGDLHHYHTPSFRGLIYEALPHAMARLVQEPSPAAVAEALVIYTVIGEGVLSETGHHLYAAALRYRRLMPGLLDALRRVQRDETRHLTYGVYLLSQLVAHDPDVWPVIERQMNRVLGEALGVVGEFYEPYAVVPFGLSLDDTIAYAMMRFARRSSRIERARDHGAALAAAADPADEVLEWMAERLTPLAVTPAVDDGGGALVVHAQHDGGPASLLVSGDVLDRYLAEEIIAALTEANVPGRLAGAPGVRLACADVGGRIVVQHPL